MKWIASSLTIALLAGPAASSFAQQNADKKAATESPAADREALERQFSEKLSGAALVGTFTIDGQEPQNLKTERYELFGVTKIKGDLWRFDARIKYGEKDLRIPIPLTVLWAGDTPVITLTETTIPPLGTFTARVMIYDDRYAGTWQHDEYGGHMFGRIEKDAASGDEGDESPE